jgi:hypothetical protein
MSGTPFRIVVAFSFFAYCCCGSAHATPKKEVAPRKVLSVSEGTYEIYQINKLIGRETFIETIYSDNELSLESKCVFGFSQKDSMTSVNTLVLEESSLFPESYESTNSSQKVKRETSIKMYANVAVITTIVNGRESSNRQVLSSGSLFLQSQLASQWSFLIKRYDTSLGGKQSMLVFNPDSKVESPVVLEYKGKEKTSINGKDVNLDYYRAWRDQGNEVRLYVDQSSNLVKVVDELQHMQFILTSSRRSSG